MKQQQTLKMKILTPDTRENPNFLKKKQVSGEKNFRQLTGNLVIESQTSVCLSYTPANLHDPLCFLRMCNLILFCLFSHGLGALFIFQSHNVERRFRV
jgi:hypothetical protein